MATQWREALVTFDRRPGRTAAADVEQLLREIATPWTLLGLTDILVKEGVLQKHDGRKIGEALLEQIDAHGAWRHPPERRPPR